MDHISYYYRDLESARKEQRQSATLIALIANFDVLRQPNSAEIKRFERLFIPLFNQVTIKTQRYAASSLSHCAYVPASICECLALQSIEISAPFLYHSPSLTNPVLCYVIARTNEIRARIIARRSGLNKRVIQSLLALNDPDINHTLQSRGYISNITGKISHHMSTEPTHTETADIVKVQHNDKQLNINEQKQATYEQKPMTDDQFMSEEYIREMLHNIALGYITPEEIRFFENHYSKRGGKLTDMIKIDQNKEPVKITG